MREKISISNKKRLSDPVVRSNLSKSAKEGYKNGRRKINVSSANKRTRELWADPDFKDAQLHRMRRNPKPNKKEISLNNLIEKACPDQYKYVGNGNTVINGMIPDFINSNGQKKVIEMFGDYWHSDRVNSKTRNSWKRTELGRIMAYKYLGFDCLIIWENELKKKSEEDLISIIKNFNDKDDHHDDTARESKKSQKIRNEVSI
jgi:G:T-mismatch repair DNA endonuclease (very short patch repair protein)